jgi:ActR/RegA family two-component response regulator
MSKARKEREYLHYKITLNNLIPQIKYTMENINKRILLVEDDLNFGAVLKDYLMLNDFDVTLAKNGMEGFEKFKKMPLIYAFWM